MCQCALDNEVLIDKELASNVDIALEVGVIAVELQHGACGRLDLVAFDCEVALHCDVSAAEADCDRVVRGLDVVTADLDVAACFNEVACENELACCCAGDRHAV